MLDDAIPTRPRVGRFALVMTACMAGVYARAPRQAITAGLVTPRESRNSAWRVVPSAGDISRGPREIRMSNGSESGNTADGRCRIGGRRDLRLRLLRQGAPFCRQCRWCRPPSGARWLAARSRPPGFVYESMYGMTMWCCAIERHVLDVRPSQEQCVARRRIRIGWRRREGCLDVARSGVTVNGPRYCSRSTR